MSIILFVVLIVLGLGLVLLFNRQANGTSGVYPTDLVIVLGGAAIVAIINHFVVLLPMQLLVVAPAMFGLMIVATVFVSVVLRYKRGNFWEALLSIAIVACLYPTTRACSYMTACLWSSRFWTTFVVTLVPVITVLAIAFIIVDFFFVVYDDGARSVFWRIAAWATKVIALIIVVYLLVSNVSWPAIGRFDWNKFWSIDNRSGVPNVQLSVIDATKVLEESTESAVEEAATNSGESVVVTEAVVTKETEVDYSWLHWYNLDLLNNQDPEDNYNFGESPIVDGYWAEDYDKELRRRMWDDPALGAADMAWLDSIVGTRYLGEFYESCKGDWAKTMNISKDTWTEDWDLYHRTLNAFFKYLDNADEMYIEVRQSGLEDQMYMNPYTLDGVPDIIVLKTPDHSGTFLVFVFMIKGVRFEVAYRCDCGFQPTNVEKIMRIEPLEEPPEPEYVPVVRETTTTPKATTKEEEVVVNPPRRETEPSEPSKEETEPSKPSREETKPSREETKPSREETKPSKEETKPSKEETKPSREETKPSKEETKPSKEETKPPETEPPKPSKVPSEAPSKNLEPNDIEGPGKDTNTGVGSEKSLEDQVQNSDHLDSYEEYKEKVKELEEANTPKQEETTKAKETEAPKQETKATEAPKPKKDDNDDKGNGDAAPIDVPATIQAPAAIKADGEEINTEPAGAWGGDGWEPE